MRIQPSGEPTIPSTQAVAVIATVTGVIGMVVGAVGMHVSMKRKNPAGSLISAWWGK